MKKISIAILILLSVILPLASCENDVETIWSDNNEARLVLNAQIRQDKATHTLFVYNSEKSHCDPVDGAAVTCTLNSKPLEVVPSEGGRYKFDAQLSAGDALEFKVSWRGLNASASAVVPEPAGGITAVTITEMIIEDEYESQWSRILESITFKDRPGVKDFYMLTVENVYHRLDAEGNVTESFAVETTVDAGDDKVLNPMGAEVSEFTGYDNDYNIFTDEMFADASYTFRVYATNGYVYSNEWVEFLNRFSEGDPYTMDRVYKVYSIDFDEYMYLQAMSARSNDIGFMTEPVVFPENVVGGHGFVTAMTPVTWTISSGPYEFSWSM